ncbi:MAG: LytTR family DNA-binding domain-containing protein [Reichenbachiella sp.]|uniref:LytR/AlgR family response regulator transcription factor n=1 Tax=Reichenbachiella sp. TaxID=2184521 RepID=UPI003262E439
MTILIIEGTLEEANRLERLIKNLDPHAKIYSMLDVIDDVLSALDNQRPDLIFLDLQLSDDIFNELFEKRKLGIPVVFTTTNDEYIQRAFKVNKISFIIKPIRNHDLVKTLNRFNGVSNIEEPDLIIKPLLEGLLKSTKEYKSRFMVKSGRGYISLDVNRIAYITAENKLNQLITFEGKKHILDFTLDQLAEMLDPSKFIKISRNNILSFGCIVKVEPFYNNRMLVMVKPPSSAEIIVSRSYLKKFKEWMEL